MEPRRNTLLTDVLGGLAFVLLVGGAATAWTRSHASVTSHAPRPVAAPARSHARPAGTAQRPAQWPQTASGGAVSASPVPSNQGPVAPFVPPASPPLPGSPQAAGGAVGTGRPTLTTSIKPDIVGLLDRDGAPPLSYASSLGGFVINVDWSQLQPVPGAPIAANNPIDQGLAQLDQLNAQGAHLLAKIRVFAGVNAPEWAKNIGGPPIQVYDPVANRSGTVGRFWTEAYGAAYDDLMSKLAAKYDGDPRIRDVTIARCTTVFAEPFIRDTGDPATVRRLLAAGFTTNADFICQKEEIDAASAWRTTHSSLSFNPYQQINPSGTTGVNEGFTKAVMSYCRQVLGLRCTLENNSIRASQQDYHGMYSSMKTLGAPICYQTAIAQRMGNLAQTINFGLSEGAIAIELPHGYESMISPSQASTYSFQLAANGTSQ